MANTVLGWDVGGAHLKAVLLDGACRVKAVQQLACPLWQGLDRLDLAVDTVLDSLDMAADMHAVTMTGELADIFADRNTGVLQISRMMAGKLACPRFFAGQGGFVGLEEVGGQAAAIASANWLASAQFIARRVGGGLFVDIGSTTSDLIPLSNSEACFLGYSDAERMRHEELVYTGVVRTPLMAFGNRVSFNGEWCPLAAEHFATAADIYRLTGELQPAYDLADTADGAGKTQEESARRLARMICRDFADATLEQWKTLAHGFRQLQLDRLKQAAMRQYSRGLPWNVPVVGAGAGSFLAAELARQMGTDYIDAARLIEAETPDLSHAAAVCYPAYAVAQLAFEALQ